MMVKLESDQSATFNIVNTLPKSILSHTKITLDEDLRRYSELNVILEKVHEFLKNIPSDKTTDF